MVNIEEIPVICADVHRHVDSFESDDSVVSSDNENSEFEIDAKQVSENNKADPTYQVGADGTKYWTSKCDEKKKPQLNQHFTTLDEISRSSKIDGNAHRVDNFSGPVPEGEISMQNLDISPNKGCGSCLKSSRELGAQDEKKKKKCGNCNQLVSRNARRTCPEPPKNIVEPL
ncbi:hypothetical protein ACET3Z_031933 [Daucus carota]